MPISILFSSGRPGSPYNQMHRDNWYRDDWVNRQDQWRGQGDMYGQSVQPQQHPYPVDPHTAARFRSNRTPSPQRSAPWDPVIGYPHTVETGYYPATATAPSAPPPQQHPEVEGRRRPPGIGAVFGNRSLDRSTRFGTGRVDKTGHTVVGKTILA